MEIHRANKGGDGFGGNFGTRFAGELGLLDERQEDGVESRHAFAVGAGKQIGFEQGSGEELDEGFAFGVGFAEGKKDEADLLFEAELGEAPAGGNGGLEVADLLLADPAEDGVLRREVVEECAFGYASVFDDFVDSSVFEAEAFEEGEGRREDAVGGSFALGIAGAFRFFADCSHRL